MVDKDFFRNLHDNGDNIYFFIIIFFSKSVSPLFWFACLEKKKTKTLAKTDEETVAMTSGLNDTG